MTKRWLERARRKKPMEQHPVLIREAALADAPAIAQLHASSWQRTYRGFLPDDYLDTEVVRERALHWTARMHAPAEGDRLNVIAESGANTVGFACAERKPHAANGTLLDNLHVSRSFQGRGLGKLLVDAVKNWARKLGETRLYLYVVEGNRQAIAFYERQGWEFAGAESHRIVGMPVTARRYVRQIRRDTHGGMMDA